MTAPGRLSRTFRPTAEALEERALPTALLVLDFTPDRIAGEARQADAFAAAFRRPRGPRRFLDFNRDGRVTCADAVLAAARVGERVNELLSGFDVQINAGDLGRDSRLGQRLLRQGNRAGTPTYVIYLGGESFDGDVGTFGEAYQAPEGFNLPYYGFAFTGNMARWYRFNDPDTAPESFAADVAATAVHEFAHLLGLGHPEGSLPGDTSILNHAADFHSADFPDRIYTRVVLYDATLRRTHGPQNPRQEMLASLAGQPAFSPRGLRYSNGVTEPRRGRHD
jgi:hypothetical protein